jgi:peptidoglycan/xylan/chitin deacetylase (PgdA/CDA1 family)
MTDRPELVRREAQDGFALGDHTWDHPNLRLLSASAQAAELDRVSAVERSLTGTVPCLFRPPYGDYDATTLALAQQRRMGVWLWSVDTQDWMARGSGASYWIRRIVRLAESEGGALRHPVVLMHNQSIGNPATVSALPTIIQFFRSRGYHFVLL